ncbi:hypothetical protein KO481_27595 [Nocardia sp. NEAU-G5]|uniref:Uncharacterized protein n=1 Tax=Nocardia albiluteola TaxID=2842303 RepID=A0ABS6B7V2_9NOCA|nr:hypothetical protein [Nocardia albiluteola]MBU3065278.1 hypothetical protein [Nocardia albiluteola]
MMGSWQIFAATMIMAGAMAGVLMRLRPQRLPSGRSVAEIRERIVAESFPPIPVLLAGHSAPEHAPDVPEAHRIMQEHLDCMVSDCPRKAAAHRVLVAAGRITPRRLAAPAR